MQAEATDRLENARSQALAQLESIREMVQALEAAEAADDDRAREEAEQRIHEDALSVEVRAGWFIPGSAGERGIEPEQFRILLCTGGPAVRILGDLNRHCEPEAIWLQCQDWFTPWTNVEICGEDVRILRRYCQCFYFGE